MMKIIGINCSDLKFPIFARQADGVFRNFFLQTGLQKNSPQAAKCYTFTELDLKRLNLKNPGLLGDEILKRIGNFLSAYNLILKYFKMEKK